MTDSTKRKNYLKGSAKVKTFSNGGHVIHVDLLLSDIQKLPVNERGYIKIDLLSVKDDKYGNDYSITENDFVPRAQSGTPASSTVAPPAGFKPTKKSTDDYPF